MTKTTTTLGAITPGEAKCDRRTIYILNERRHNRVFVDVQPGYDMHDRRTPADECIANAALYADAHNTAQKTGKLPSQLLQERDELVGALDRLLATTKVLGVRCQAFHHVLEDQHPHHEACPVTARYYAAIANATEVLSKYPKP